MQQVEHGLQVHRFAAVAGARHRQLIGRHIQPATHHRQGLQRLQRRPGQDVAGVVAAAVRHRTVRPGDHDDAAMRGLDEPVADDLRDHRGVTEIHHARSLEKCRQARHGRSRGKPGMTANPMPTGAASRNCRMEIPGQARDDGKLPPGTQAPPSTSSRRTPGSRNHRPGAAHRWSSLSRPSPGTPHHHLPGQLWVRKPPLL